MGKKLIPILAVLIINSNCCFAQNFDWILYCGYNPDKPAFSYFDAIKGLKNSGISKSTVSQEMLKQLPDIYLGRNNECIYEAIIYFGDESIVNHFKKRVSTYDESHDRPGYSSDILKLLLLRDVILKTETEFITQLKELKRPYSLIYFLEMHNKQLPIQSKLSVYLWVVQSNKIGGEYAYYLSFLIEEAYEKSPKEYLKFLYSLKDPPFDFTCVLDDSCP